MFFKVSKILKVPKVPKVSKVFKVPKVLKVLKVFKVPKVSKVFKVLKVPKVFKVFKVSKVPKVFKVFKVFKVSFLPLVVPNVYVRNGFSLNVFGIDYHVLPFINGYDRRILRESNHLLWCAELYIQFRNNISLFHHL